MDRTNGSAFSGFVLLGFSSRPQLESALFVVILATYFLSLLGNGTIILLSAVDPRLHTPMYFFLSNLSFMDICLTTCTVPQTLAGFRGGDRTISYEGCVAQLLVALGLGGVECVLLAVMAYDRWAAVCKPLRYTAIMHPGLCSQLVAAAWLTGFGNAVAQTALTMALPLCGHNRLDHFFCEVPALLKLACVDTSRNQAKLLAVSVLFLVVPLSLILVSYSHITLAVLSIKSTRGRQKAFGTCGSHLLVVTVFFGTLISMYLQPPSRYSQDLNKSIALFYTLVTPLLNPLIYTLRNKQVKGALRRLAGRVWIRQRAAKEMENQTLVSEFLLLGFSNWPGQQSSLFVLFLCLYLTGLFGNLLILMTIGSDHHLHTPMYFFLANLSLVDLCLLSATVPKMLLNIQTQTQSISYPGCLSQMYFCVMFANMDNFLLTVMAYDRYVAICYPLHYSAIMTPRLCASLVAIPWVIAILNPLLHTLMMARLCFCSDNIIHHFFCDINSLLPLSCSDTSLNQLMVLAVVGLIFVVPSVCILASYSRIVSAVMKVPSAQGKLKAFSTCGSHLALVILFYGAITGIYMSPSPNHSTEDDSAASVIFMVVAPVLNPFIYSLRNNELKRAFKKTLDWSKIFSQ
ncbi:olfactory receptor 2B2-like [Ctenodactylus gundi]